MTASLDRSKQWWRRAEAVIPMGTQTLSKSPTQWMQGVAPIYLERGQGAHVWDVDGTEYIDYPMALGPVLLGYRDPAVDKAIIEQLDKGITFTLMHPLEVEVAEKISASCPGVEAVRFAKSGSDALSAAVRAARAITGRDRVLVAGYHGWHDWYIGTTSRRAGVPRAVTDLTGTFRYNDLEHLRRCLDKASGSVAAVVLEPSGAELPHDGFLQGAIDLAHEHGALCVFDEVITGFRIGRGGARSRYGVEPDLSCYGKALGNGMPIAAVGGRWSVMKIFEDVFFSGTHGGETLSLAAANAVLDTLENPAVLGRVSELGHRMRSELLAAVARHGVGDFVKIGGEPERTVVGFAEPHALVMRSWVQQCLLDQGVLFNGSMFICWKHTEEDIDRALRGFDSAFAGLVESGPDVRSRLRAPALQPVFRDP